jgi:cell division protein FtsB
LNVPVQVYQYHGSDAKLQGQFNLTLNSSGKATVFTIAKSGAHPLLTFNLSRQLNWKLSRSVFANFVDSRAVNYLLQFCDSAAAAQATAVIGVILSVQNARDLARFDASVAAAGRGISEGDRIMVTYHVFAFSTYPTVSACVASRESWSSVLARDRMAVGWVAGLLGMVSGTTRVVYVPAQQTAFEGGGRDPTFPNAPLVIVTALLRCKFRDEADGDDADGRRRGAGEATICQPPEATVWQPVESVLPPLPDSAALPTARLEELERAIGARMELLAGGAVGLAAQVGARQREIALLERAIENELAQDPAPPPPGMVDAVRAEIDALRAENADLEAAARADEAKAGQIHARIRACPAAAQGRTRTLIRRMIDDVYRDTTALFEERRLYAGNDVSDGLRRMLKKHSVTCFDDMRQNGLF